ncbi:MAG: sorting protein, partial [Phenylobacterium sp.]|nr:sorting protein [Phenylobacterium sp.]
MGATVGIDQDLLSRTTIRTPAPLAPGYSALGRSFAISQFTAPGFPPNVQTFTGFEAATCTGAQCTGGVSAELGGHFAATRVIPLGSLSEYAGTGTVAIERTSSVTVTVEASSGAMAPGLLTTATGLITLGGAPASNVYRVTYDYLNFARPSFDPLTEQQTLNIDFGTLTLGASPVTQIFSMSNLGDEHSAGLSLSSFAPANSTSPFGNTLLAFENLGGGASLTSGFSFAATSVGSFSQSYTL